MSVISRYRRKSARVAPRDVGRLTTSLWGGRSYIVSWANLRSQIGISSSSCGGCRYRPVVFTELR